MAATSPAERIPASKLRRIRQAETKQRLYKTASQDQCLAAVHTQLVMLTSTIDNLHQHLIHSQTHVPPCHPYCWNLYAKEFTPCSHQSAQDLEQGSTGSSGVASEPVPRAYSDAAVALTEDVLEEAAHGSSGDSYAISCNVCWEILPNKYGCQGLHLCRRCAVAGALVTAGIDANAEGNGAHISSQSPSTWASLISQAGPCDISGIEFYDSCRLVAAALAGVDEPLVLHLPPGELKDFLENVRLRRIAVKSNLGKKYTGETSSTCAAQKASSELDLDAAGGPPGLHGKEERLPATQDAGDARTSCDEEWEFLQKQLHVFLDELEEQALQVYGSFCGPDSEVTDINSMSLLTDDARTKAVETVVEDTVSGLLSYMSSQKAR